MKMLLQTLLLNDLLLYEFADWRITKTVYTEGVILQFAKFL